jgi:hypothetical protein
MLDKVSILSQYIRCRLGIYYYFLHKIFLDYINFSVYWVLFYKDGNLKKIYNLLREADQLRAALRGRMSRKMRGHRLASAYPYKLGPAL